MPDIGPLHPQLVHFVIALGLVGVVLRLISLVARGAWLGPAAATLLLLSAGVSVLAAIAGEDAHGPAERIPGAREAVQQHEDWGERTRNLLLITAGLELLALGFASKRAGRPLRFVAAAGGLAAAFAIYKASDLGGHLVYHYAGGVGTRSGDPEHIDNLLVAGLYHAARLDRDSGRAEAAARLIEELAQRRPADTSVRLLAIESQLLDRKDPEAALAGLAALPLPGDHRLAPRHGLLTAQALVASGQVDSARVILTALIQRFPENQSLKSALEKLR